MKNPNTQQRAHLGVVAIGALRQEHGDIPRMANLTYSEVAETVLAAAIPEWERIRGLDIIDDVFDESMSVQPKFVDD